MKQKPLITISLLLSLLILFSTALAAQDILLKNADIYTFDQGVLKGYDLLIIGGKITRIDKNIPSNQPKNNNRQEKPIETMDLSGKSIVPGLIDSHTHMALLGNYNEGKENVTPEIKMDYQVDPDDPKIYYCLSGGVTMVHTMHGSANVIGGENVVLKLKWGKTADEMMERRALRTLKMALGENPKRTSKNYPQTRMGISQIIDQSFGDALRYREEWKEYYRQLRQTSKKYYYRILPPRRNLRLEALLEALDKQMVIRCHSYRAEEVLQLIRLSRKYGFKIAAVEHIHQAYRIAEQLKAENIAVTMFVDSWNYKTEASEFTPYGFKILYDAGVEISLNSDNIEIMRRLHMEAGKLRRYTGLSDLQALKTVTLNPARLLGVDSFTGSIQVGKDADLAVFDGHPLSSMSKCVLTIIEGTIYFNRSMDKYVSHNAPGSATVKENNQ